MSAITTHVLDTARGRPAAGMQVRLEAPDGSVADGVTDDDGRVGELGSADALVGTYRLVLDTGAYFAVTGQQGFFPEVVVTFEVTDPSRRHHVPLLLSPFSYSTYRGS